MARSAAGEAGADAAGAPGACAVATAPGKAILFGEHFVVHGMPAVVCAIGIGVTVTAGLLPSAVRVDSPLGSYRAAGAGEGVPGGLPAPLAAVCGISMEAGRRAGTGLRVRVDSGVPLGAGLGSSSAWCVAAAGAVQAACGEAGAGPPSAAGAAEAAVRHERASFGRASGADTAACAHGGFGTYRTGGLGWRRLGAGCRVRLVVADTGQAHSTRRMVEAVSRFREESRAEFDRAAAAAGRIAARAAAALRAGDVPAIGRLMSENHTLLSGIGVSTGRADALAEAAREAGSPGAKITGAGGGGCVIALPAAGRGGEEAVAGAMRGAGAAECFAVDAGVAGLEIRMLPQAPGP